jgi:hypothetical protein
MGMSYLLTGGAAKYGSSFRGSAPIDALVTDTDAVGSQASTSLFQDTVNSYVLALSKGAGNVTPRLGWSQGGGVWTHEDLDNTHSDAVACSEWEIGTWNGGSDLFDGWFGVTAWFEGAMSDANKATLDANWRTSDIQNNAHGTPVGLIEFDVAATSLVDLIGNATGRSITGSPTLDTSEFLNGWTFDGVGAPVYPTHDPDYSKFPKELLRR